MSYMEVSIWLIFAILAGVVVGAPLTAMLWKSRLRAASLEPISASCFLRIQRPWIPLILSAIILCGFPAAILVGDRITGSRQLTDTMSRYVHQVKGLKVLVVGISLLYVTLGSVLVGAALLTRRTGVVIACVLAFLGGLLMQYYVTMSASLHSLAYP